jgi:hypothetical protein
MGFISIALARILPGATRYFIVSRHEVDYIEPGIATLIRKKGRLYSYLYMDGEMDMLRCEGIHESSFFWGPWSDGDMRKGSHVVQEIDELEAFILIRRAGEARKGKLWAKTSK